MATAKGEINPYEAKKIWRLLFFGVRRRGDNLAQALCRVVPSFIFPSW